MIFKGFRVAAEVFRAKPDPNVQFAPIARFHPESALFRPGCVNLQISRERRDILSTPPRKPLISLPGRKSSG
jgi:hypothetical protein